MLNDIVKKLPKDIPISQYLKDKSLFYFKVSLYGCSYYIPVTKEMKKLLHIQKRGKKWIIPNSLKITDMLRSIIDAIYIQIRDTIGASIHQSISQDVGQGFEKLFDKYLEGRIEDGFQKLLPYKKA